MTARSSASLVAALLAGASLAPLAAGAAAPSPEKPMEFAKRRIPVVEPLVLDGVRYEPVRRPDEHGFTQHGGVLGAVDEKTGALLWAVQLYETPIDPQEERDVQDIYIVRLATAPDGHAVLATDERGRAWRVDLRTHGVTPAP